MEVQNVPAKFANQFPTYRRSSLLACPTDSDIEAIPSRTLTPKNKRKL